MQEERRTVATRPGAMGFTPPSASASNPCLNCGTNVQLQYCPECGQRVIDPDPTLEEFAREAAGEFLHWDGKLLSTFRLLVSRPGALTEEYLMGRRVRFISPLRVYLMCSVFFFFVKSLTPDLPESIRKGNSITTQIGAVTIQESHDNELAGALDSLAVSKPGIAGAWNGHVARALRHTRELGSAISEALPKAMFVLVPIFAALAALVFRKRRMRYPQHLTFALHVHAFMFLALLLTLETRIDKTHAWLAGLFTALSFSAIGGYLVLATRRVYALTTGGAVAKSALLAFAYFIVYALALAMTFLLIVLLKF